MNNQKKDSKIQKNNIMNASIKFYLILRVFGKKFYILIIIIIR
jgi:hypothetical protein